MTQINPLPPKEVFESETGLSEQSVLDKQTVVNANWGATLLTAAGLLFVVVGFAIAEINSWKDYVLLGAPMMLFVLGLISIVLLRRGRIVLGTGLIFVANLIVPLVEHLLQKDIAVVIFIYVLVSSGLMLWRTLPKSSRRWALPLAGIALLFIIGVEAIDSPIRVNPADELVTFILIVTIILVVAFIVEAVRQSWDIVTSSIRNRLTTIVVGAAIIPVVLVSIVLGWATYIQIRNALTQDAFDKLAAVQTIKANQISGYMAERQSDMEALSDTVASLLTQSLSNMDAVNALKHSQISRLFITWDADVRDVASDPGVVTGMIDLTSSFQDMGANKARALYLGKADLQIAKDEGAYNIAHLEQHGFFSGYTAIHGYPDAFLIDPAGNVVYSVQKTDVFGTNLVTGAYKDSSLAKLYKNLSNGQAGKAYIADITLFENEYAMFIGAPIYEGPRQVGILAYRLPLDVIKSVIAERTGQGATGETYLIALEEDGRITYRSDRVTAGSGEFVVGYDLSSIATQFMRNALSGQTGNGLTISSTGEAVLNSYRPLGVEGLNWAVMSRVAAEEALSPTRTRGEKDFLSIYKENYGYYDIFLIEPKGTIFYSVLKEKEYKTNILTGEYKDTNLGSMIAEVVKTEDLRFADFAFYAPSGGRPAAFFGIPVLNENNEIVLIVAAQASQDQLNAIMAETTGLGKTGETYIIGEDKLRRTETRFLADLGVDTTILNERYKVETIASTSVLEGKTGQDTFIDARGIPVLGIWSPVVINVQDATDPKEQIWGVIAKLDESEALAPVNRLAGTLGLIIGLAVLGIGALAVSLGARFATRFVNPIISLTNTASQVAAGNMNLSAEVNSEDEIGTLSNAFNTMTSQLRDLIGSLEGRVAARTKDLATVAEVGTATASILDTNRLLNEVVELTKERFNLYHSHIYLLDEKGENLVLTAGAGEPGRIMAAEKRSIPVSREQSLVARAARERKGVTVNDVTQAPDFLPNPLLPNTRSELAVPMIVGANLIGVFDIQSDQVGRFAESDVNIQTTLASQIATSIQNARSFERSREQADLETLVNAIGQKIQRATTVEGTLQTAVREIGLALGAVRVSANIRSANVKNETSEN
jgi:methyl-accepting chemotaxis protein